MARVLLAATMLALTAHTAYGADVEPDETTVAVAAEAGVEPMDLLGAVLATGLGPRAYLQAVGELEPPAPPMGVWDRLAMCESHGDWSANTGNHYFGGVQFDLQTWHAYGGVGYPHQASRATQIAIAEHLRAARGYQPWPVCSIRVGLR